MKKTTLFILFFACSTIIISNLFAQQLTYSKLRDSNGISVGLTLDSYEVTSLNYRGEAMHEISLSGIFIPNDEGMPNLPRISRFVAVPKGAEIMVSVKRIDTETLQNINIAPALRIQAIPEEPITDYVKNTQVYETNAFYPQNVYEISEVTSLRGVNTVLVGITPFQFNPVTKELIVITNIELEIEYIGGSREYDDPKYRSPWFDPILKNALLNYEALEDIAYTPKSSRGGTGCEYLIVIPNRADFEPYANQIKEFRTKQGIYTKVMRLDEMGVTTTAQLKTFFHNAYNTWDTPPVAVLLMADHDTNMALGIPAETISHPYTQAPTYGTCITDNQYASLGSNLLPNMVFGRMAAETAAQMAVLVSKFIEYETQPCTEPSYYQNPITALGWQTERWFQICSEAVGGYWRNMGKTPVRINKIYQPPQNTSIWSDATNTATVVNYFGPSGAGYIPASPNELSNWDSGTPAQVVTAINNGAFALQHRDHGFENGWGEPAFQSSHINQLTNVGKMTYVFTINCLTGKFNNSSPCFGEVFHRYTYQGQNAGCVGFLGPTEVSYSFVNDAFAWGMYDLYDPNFLPNYGPSYGPNNGPYVGYSGNWMPAFGNVAGKYFLYQSSWPSNSSSVKPITYQMFTAHSDVFLRLFTEVPQTNNVSHADVALAGNPNFMISAAAGTLIALTTEIDGNVEILDVAVATGGTQTMTLPCCLPPATEITVVVTGQNYLRYEAKVNLINPELCETPVDFTGTSVGGTAIITWKQPVNIDGILLGYNIFRDSVKINEVFISEQEYLDENLTGGTYHYQVSAVYTHCESEFTEMVEVTIHPQFCEPPIHLSVAPESQAVIITWNEPENIDGELIGYNVYRNEDERINKEPITETRYVDEKLPDGTYTYRISAVYEHCEESELTDSVEIMYVNIRDLQTSSFKLYPNPANCELRVTSDELQVTSIEIYDICGRKQLSIVNCQLSINLINVSHLQSGTYFVKIYSENNVPVTKCLEIIK